MKQAKRFFWLYGFLKLFSFTASNENKVVEFGEDGNLLPSNCEFFNQGFDCAWFIGFN